MSGPAESKIPLKVKAYIHKKDPKTRSKVVHIDIEGEKLGKVIKPGEITFCKGKKGGIFIALKSDMIKRAEKVV